MQLVQLDPQQALSHSLRPCYADWRNNQTMKHTMVESFKYSWCRDMLCEYLISDQMAGHRLRNPSDHRP